MEAMAEEHGFTDPLNVFAACFMALNGAFGLVCNALIVYIFINSSSERTSFNLVCVSRAIGNSIILLWLFVATFIPITLLGKSPFSPVYETFVVAISNTIYSGLQFTGILIAVNRFCAMFIPILYSKLFSFYSTSLFVFLIFLYRAVRITFQLVHFVPLECFMVYSSFDLTWSPNLEAKCEEDTSSTINFTYIYVVVMGSLNVATFTKIYFFYKSSEISEQDLRRKVKKNKALFLQTMIQDVITLVDMVFTFQLSLLSTERVWSFLCGTVIWQCVHSFDGLIMIMFNERLTFIKKSLFASSVSPSVALVSPSKVFITIVKPK